jgi:hypothetical protein
MGSNVLNFRTPEKQVYQEACDQLDINYSGPLRKFAEKFAEDPDFASDFLEEESDRFSNFGLSDQEYSEVIELSGSYFGELFSGDKEAALDIGEEIYSIDSEIGDYVARVTVYLEENGFLGVR